MRDRRPGTFVADASWTAIVLIYGHYYRWTLPSVDPLPGSTRALTLSVTGGTVRLGT
jgi:hypothetical protein